MPAGRPRIDKYADADMLVLTRADEIFRAAKRGTSPTEAVRRVVRAVLAKDARWCLDLDGRPLDIGPANLDSIVKRVLSRLEPKRITIRGKRVATRREKPDATHSPRVQRLALAKAVIALVGSNLKLMNG